MGSLYIAKKKKKSRHKSKQANKNDKPKGRKKCIMEVFKSTDRYPWVWWMWLSLLRRTDRLKKKKMLLMREYTLFLKKTICDNANWGIVTLQIKLHI